MTERMDSRGQFEDDLRSLLRAIAPLEAPASLRAAIAAMPTSVAQRPVRDLLDRWGAFAGSVAAIIVVLAIAGAAIALRSPSAPGNGSFPRSSLVSGFVEQVDGAFGYRMLRPSNWTPTAGDFPNGRLFLAPGSTNQNQGVVLFAVNLSLPAAHAGFAEVWQAFEQAPTLDGWTAGLQPLFRGQTVTLLRTLPHAKIYAFSYPGLSKVQLAAYVVDQGQPLMLMLEASNAYADVGRLQNDGIVDDFTTIAGSVIAVPADPAKVVPALPMPTPPPPPSS